MKISWKQLKNIKLLKKGTIIAYKEHNDYSYFGIISTKPKRGIDDYGYLNSEFSIRIHFSKCDRDVVPYTDKWGVDRSSMHYIYYLNSPCKNCESIKVCCHTTISDLIKDAKKKKYL